MAKSQMNLFFAIGDNSYGISVWIEKGLLKYLENQPVLITLKKGLFKRLKIEVGSEIIQSQQLLYIIFLLICISILK
jgi:hypothetical protein